MKLRLEVKQTQHGWIWELYNGTNPVWMERTASFFATPEEAMRDGARAQARIERRGL